MVCTLTKRDNMAKKFIRTRERMIGGVCGGIAQFFELDPTLVRIAYALLTIFTLFSGIVVYIILWIIVPKE